MIDINEREKPRPNQRPALGVGLVLAAMFWGQTASGQTTQVTQPLVSDAASDKEAERLFNEGVTAAKKEQWEEARSKFEAALKVKYVPQYVANLGRAELRLGKPKQAAEHLEVFLREDKDAAPAWRREVEIHLVEARSKIVFVTLSVDVAGASVLVDGVPVPGHSLARPLPENPGTHLFEAYKDGFVATRRTVDLAAGSNEIVALHLSPLTVVKGPDLGETKELPPYRKEVIWMPWALAGGTALLVGGVGVGVWRTIEANRESDVLGGQNQYLQTKTLRDVALCEPSILEVNKERCVTRDNTGQTLRRLTIEAEVGYIVGGVGALGLVAMLVWPTSYAHRTGLRSVTPMVDQKLGGLILSGSF
jgi:hypothetical protein